MNFRSLKAELALLRSLTPEDTEDLVSIQLSEAGLDHTQLIKLVADAGVPKKAHTILRKTLRQTKNVSKLLATSHSEGGIHPSESKGRAIPLSLIQELLGLLDIGGVYRTSSDSIRRQPVRPCPFAARELYDRLLLARRHAWWVRALPGRGLRPGGGRREERSDTYRKSCCYITNSELAGLLGPVVVEMRACLEYVESFCGSLETTRGGDAGWVDLSELRTCVLKLMGFWPRDVVGDYPGCAFDLPSGLSMLLYPQICLDRDEMVGNLGEVVLGPGWDGLRGLEVIAYGLWAEGGV